MEIAALMPGGLGLVATKSGISVWMKKLMGWIEERIGDDGIKRYWRGPRMRGSLRRSQIVAAYKEERGEPRAKQGSRAAAAFSDTMRRG